MLLKLDYSHDALYCCVKYLIIECKDEIFIVKNLSSKSDAQKQMAFESFKIVNRTIRSSIFFKKNQRKNSIVTYVSISLSLFDINRAYITKTVTTLLNQHCPFITFHWIIDFDFKCISLCIQSSLSIHYTIEDKLPLFNNEVIIISCHSHTTIDSNVWFAFIDYAMDSSCHINIWFLTWKLFNFSYWKIFWLSPHTIFVSNHIENMFSSCL